MKRIVPAIIAAALLSTLVALTAPLPNGEISASEKRSVIEALADVLTNNYVFPEKAKAASKSIQTSLDEGEYDDIEDGREFAQTVSKQVNSIIDDAHFRVRFSDLKLPKRQERSEPTEEEREARRTQVRKANAMVEKVERLPGNIGYLEMRGFAPAEAAKRPVAAAMSFLKETDAMILDLRRNGGGDPACVQLVCSYFFGDEPVHLNSIYFRPTDETTEFWTLEEVEGERYLDKPVYVLTSPRTGSAAEECSYNLKHLKRATIVGETTWGGANPGGMFRLGDHIDAFIPTGRAINPITGTNWEGVGVKPDVEIDAEEALIEAQKMALKALIEAEENKTRTASLKRRLDELKRV